MLLVVLSRMLKRTPSQDLNYDYIYSMGMYYDSVVHILKTLLIMRKYIFDVDGTLTPSRKKIESEFAEFFLEFIKTIMSLWLLVVIVRRLLEQVTPEIL